MDLSRKPERVVASVADFRRGLIRKITDQTVAELAREKWISPSAGRKWKRMVEWAEKTAASLDDTLVPAHHVRDLEQEIEELKRFAGKQAVTIQILKEKGSL